MCLTVDCGSLEGPQMENTAPDRAETRTPRHGVAGEPAMDAGKPQRSRRPALLTLFTQECLWRPTGLAAG